MKERLLPIDADFDPSAQRAVGMLAAQLDDQLRILARHVERLAPIHLEWQPAPGMNTVGMLLAHMAIVEVYWLQAAAAGLSTSDAGDVSMRILGIGLDDDGMPAPRFARHPQSLAGKELRFYLALLDSARGATRRTLRGWKDGDLDRTYTLEGTTFSYRWTVYHVLEHFCGHAGQIRLLMRQMRDAGILEG